MIDIDLALRRATYRLDAKFSVADTGILGLVGPSGSGKTSLLRVIAGLDQPHQGLIKNGEDIWYSSDGVNVPTQKRRVGVVFQDMRLFPHLSVQENLSLAAKWGQTAAIDADLIEALELTTLLGRRPARLSGGEARRVALARALAQQPQLLLLDEPLNGLDPDQRLRILPNLIQAIEIAGIPAIFVSHDPDDVGYLCRDFIEITRSTGRDDGRDDVRSYEVLQPKPAGPQIKARWAGVNGAQGCVDIEQERILLPQSVRPPSIPVGSQVLLQGSKSQAFLSEDNAIPPSGFIKLKVNRNAGGGLETGAGKLDIGDFALSLDDFDQIRQPVLYFRPISIIHQT